MIRRGCAAIGCLLIVASVCLSREPRSPAVLYTLPADGAWVEYDCKVVDAAGKTVEATLRLSAVGTKEERGERLRRIEIQLTVGPRTSEVRKLRALLVSEKTLKETGSLPASVVQAVAQDDGRKSVRRLSGDSLDDLTGLGMQGKQTAFRIVDEKTDCETPLGKYVVRKATAEKKREADTLVYAGWLTSDVPFGWARFQIVEQTERGPGRVVFSAIACRAGKDARGNLDIDTKR